MLQRKKTAIIMLLVQILLVACGYYILSENQTNDWSGGLVISAVFALFWFPLWLCVWSWGLNLTAKVALTNNELNVIARGTIIIAVFLVSLFTIIWIFGWWFLAIMEFWVL